MDKSLLICTFGAFLAIVGFAIDIETPKHYIIRSGIVGGISGFVYLFGEKIGMGVVGASFVSALAVAIVSHYFARKYKTPVTVFLVAGFLITVPGSGMYRIVSSFMEKDNAMTSFYLSQTLQVAGVIALAIFIVDAWVDVMKRRSWKKKEIEKCNKQQ